MRKLKDIAGEIEADWPRINNHGARIALDAMKTLGDITDPYYFDPNGYGIVASFLTHAQGWHGPVARRVKRELRVMCGHPRP
jgi:hypothetical protein